MIRRISKNNDYLDIVRGCPTGILDDVYSIKYFISGHPETEIEATFERSSRYLEVVLPSSDLKTLGNGILVRKSLYKKANDSYPDGYYNLEFVESLDVWLGDEETDSPIDPEYVTEDELVERLAPYAETSWVEEQGYLTSVPAGYATESWVSSQQFITSAALTGYATESWVMSQGYLTSETIPTDIATQSWVSSNFLSTTALAGYATESWVQSQGYITSTGLSGLATQSWVSSNFLSTTALTGYATESWVSSNYVSTTTLSSYTTFSDINSYISSFWRRAAEEFYSDYVPRREIGSYLSGYATESWVSSQQFATESWVQSLGYIPESQVISDIYSVLGSDGYVTYTDVFVTYSAATQSWATSQFLEESKVWTGTQAQWNALTSEQQATYKIALITE